MQCSRPLQGFIAQLQGATLAEVTPFLGVYLTTEGEKAWDG